MNKKIILIVCTILVIAGLAVGGFLLFKGEDEEATEVKPNVLESIRIEGTMSKTEYDLGDSWDKTGLKFILHYSIKGDMQLGVNYKPTFTPEHITSEDIKEVTVTMSYEGKTISKTITGITVKPDYIQNIAVKKAPRTQYNINDFFDPTGLIITEIYNSGETKDVSYEGNEADFSFNPSLSVGLLPIYRSIQITYKGTYNFNQDISVVDSTPSSIRFSVEPSSIRTGEIAQLSAEFNVPSTELITFEILPGSPEGCIIEGNTFKAGKFTGVATIVAKCESLKLRSLPIEIKIIK